jgi:hypothetical protein
MVLFCSKNSYLFPVFFVSWTMRSIKAGVTIMRLVIASWQCTSNIFSNSAFSSAILCFLSHIFCTINIIAHTHNPHKIPKSIFSKPTAMVIMVMKPLIIGTSRLDFDNVSSLSWRISISSWRGIRAYGKCTLMR